MRQSSIILPVILMILDACLLNDGVRPALDCIPGSSRVCDPENSLCKGDQTCESKGIWSVCVARPIQQERCGDDQDRDCSGAIGDGISIEEGVVCGFSDVGKCRLGYFHCENGILNCVGAVYPRLEICDNFDNDCDQQIDEDLNPTDLSQIKACYTGPIHTLNVGSCRPGFERCENGQILCIGEQRPQLPVCDRAGEDLDCNGKIDGYQTARGIDIAFVIDTSGSMTTTLPAVQNTLAWFARGYGGGQIRIAAVLMPGNTESSCSTYFDFLDPNDAIDLVDDLGFDDSGLEASLDCPEYAVKNLSWVTANTDHYLIEITDEEPQTYLIPLNTEITAGDSLNSIQAKFYGFVRRQDSIGFDDIALRTGGSLYFLDSPEQVESDLTNLLKGIACGG